MAELPLDTRTILIIAAIALAAIYLANNVQEIGKLVMPRTQPG